MKQLRYILLSCWCLFVGVLYAQTTPSVTLPLGTVKDFHAPAQNNVHYTWYLDGITQDEGNTFTFTADEPGIYLLQLQAEVDGCVSPLSAVQITVESELPPIIPAIFFTPNGDGINDTWEIENIEYYPLADIEIYDRYHKLLVRYKGTDTGWDGEYNNHPMPMDDYWYLIRLTETRDRKSGHFNLKR
ncbi:MAG: T9SS type B sorting domain-containing protein [Paludibacteraceae bacterium]|nr:T9SS type B sorting domain-containing protein [Paludibacteraceae bacterium]